MEKINYDLKMNEIITEIKNCGKIPTLLLHTCCAPCSTRAITSLSNYFKITVFYYNPNIEPETEYIKRKEEQKRFLKEYKSKYELSFLDCDYEHEKFMEVAKGFEEEKEGGKRCPRCFRLRLEKTAMMAKKFNFDYFGTSLTVSPYKNVTLLNEIGSALALTYEVPYLFSDFKKHDGYKESIELSKFYHLYRQDYCGCIFSKLEREKKVLEKSLMKEL